MLTTPTTPIVDTIGYTRVSTESQAATDRTSLPEQRRAITEHALRLGRVLVPECIFEDPGASGATAEGRPAFMRMLAYCEANPRTASTPGAVLVLNDSRFGRFDDPEEATHWRFVLKRMGWIVRFAEGDEIADGTARGVMRFIGSAQASEYRANLKRTASRASRATAEQGRWSTRAPLGYRRLVTRHDGSQRVLEAHQRKAEDEITRLTPGPIEEQELVRLVFETYAAGGISLGMLVKQLRARWPAKKWSRATLHAMLKNPVYAGDVVWCRRLHRASTSPTPTARPMSEWVMVRDAHPALVSRELYLQAQQLLQRNFKERRATSGGYPLSGLLHCACGSAFRGGGGKRGPDHDPSKYRFYREGITDDGAAVCSGRIATLRKQWVEEAVVREIAAVTADPAVQAVIAQEIDAAIAAATRDTSGRSAAIEAEQRKVDVQRARLVSAIASGTVTEREAGATMSELRARAQGYHAELERLRFADRRIAQVTTLRDRLVATTRDFAALALRAGGPALRELVRPWLASAVYDKSDRTLTLRIRRVPEVGMIFPDHHQSALALSGLAGGMTVSGRPPPTCERTAPPSTCPSPSACSPHSASSRPSTWSTCCCSASLDWTVPSVPFEACCPSLGAPRVARTCPRS
ncbi:MAG: recombinase [Gemmatimonadetes bacterium]|nr:recombinase [Gemmatimonadota bacterium]